MSFFTSLTGLRAANTELSVSSNNIANVGTTGFKKSKASFGDIFATSPLQKQSSVVGQGVALNGIRQQFSQGSIEFSSNTLDLAISGDGFFPMKSADGNTDVYSRSGAFTLDQQGRVVDSGGRLLMASQVDAVGKPVGDELIGLSIPARTTGEADQTTDIGFELNLPADAAVIDAPFNINDATTYNKSSAITVYDQAGKSYLANVYYVKTANASADTVGGSTNNPTANEPASKWQTYMFIDGQRVVPDLQPAENNDGEALYINQYGELKPFSEIQNELVNAKSQKFTLDGLTDVRDSVPATLEGQVVPNQLGFGQGFNFFNDLADENPTFDEAALTEFASIDVDGSGNPVMLNLLALAQQDKAFTGNEIAEFIEGQLNDEFGDKRYFDLSTEANRTFEAVYNDGDAETTIAIDLTDDFPDLLSQTEATEDQIVAAIQAQIDAELGAGAVTVGYDAVARSFTYQVEGALADLSLQGSNGQTNDLFQLDAVPNAVDEDGFYSVDTSGDPAVVIANGELRRPADEQRYGIAVTYNNATNTFSVASGTTGDSSEIELNFDSGTEAAPNFNAAAATFLGFAVTEADPAVNVVTSDAAVRGLDSLPAVTRGGPIGTNVEGVFSVGADNNTFEVNVNDVKGTISLPVSENYTMDTFTSELERQINQLESVDGAQVSGVQVAYDQETNSLSFTTGNVGDQAFISVRGSSTWGMSNAMAGRGETTTWIKPTQATSVVDGVEIPEYIDQFGEETIDPAGFEQAPAWSPVFLDKGELTFDKNGKLLSPADGVAMETVFLAGGQALDLSVNYAGTTQFAQPFSVRNQFQNGVAEGDLVGLDISDDGLVTASYSNGSQNALGKVLLANFPSTEGLNQLGDSTFVATAKSGLPSIGEPGSSNFGSLRSGALEGSNVDLTAELVGLITAQRNFQANAKALETSSGLTSTILNI